MSRCASPPVGRSSDTPICLPSGFHPQPGDATLATAIADRRSRHDYGVRPLDLLELATLLHAAYGVTEPAGPHQALRTAPSGGALYPLELYVVCQRIEKIESGSTTTTRYGMCWSSFGSPCRRSGWQR